MFGPVSFSSLPRRFGSALAVGAVVAAAGCSSGGASSTPASSSVTSSVTSSVSSAPTSAPATSPASSSSPTTPASPRATASASSRAASGPTGCATRDLRVSLGQGSGAAGSVYLPIEFTNTSGATCTLYGYPGVSMLAGTPLAQVGAAAERSTAQAPSLVTLAPGQTASALLRVVNALNFPQATCSPTPTTELRVYPPNQTASVDLPYKSTGCASNSVKLMTIRVVQPGTGG